MCHVKLILLLLGFVKLIKIGWFKNDKVYKDLKMNLSYKEHDYKSVKNRFKNYSQTFQTSRALVKSPTARYKVIPKILKIS